MTDRFDQLFEGRSFTIKTGKSALDLACCDCGLVRSIGAEIVDSKTIRLTFRTRHAETEKRRNQGLCNLVDGVYSIKWVMLKL